MKKYYRVKKDTPIWDAGAIIATDCSGDYRALEDVWNRSDKKGSVYAESDEIVEASKNEEFFERVYASKSEKALFVTKEKLIEGYNNMIK